MEKRKKIFVRPILEIVMFVKLTEVIFSKISK